MRILPKITMAAALALSVSACATMKDKPMEPMAETSKACMGQGFVVFFDTGSAKLDPAAIVEIDRIGAAYRTCELYRIEVQGFADSVGNSNVNSALSDSRAETVFDALTARGVTANRARIVPMGEMTTADTESPDAFERRVVVQLIP